MKLQTVDERPGRQRNEDCAQGRGCTGGIAAGVCLTPCLERLVNTATSNLIMGVAKLCLSRLIFTIDNTA